MKKIIISFLNKPFLFIENGLHKVVISASFSAVIFFFLVLFKPTFGHEEMAHLPLYFLGGISLITFLCFILNLLVLPLLFKKWFNPQTWNIRKTLLFSFFFIVIISLSNYLYLTFNNFPFIQYLNFLSIIGTTALIGFVPSLLLVMYMEKYQKIKEFKSLKSKENSQLHDNESNFDQKLFFEAKIGNDHLEIFQNQLLFLKSEGNYIKIFYQDHSDLKTKLIRNSLNSIEIDLADHTNIKRVHRSYLVNMDSKITIEGNSRNGSIRFENYNLKVPVSRSFFKNSAFPEN